MIVQVGRADAAVLEIADADSVAVDSEELMQQRCALYRVHVDEVLGAAAGQSKSKTIDALKFLVIVDLNRRVPGWDQGPWF